MATTPATPVNRYRIALRDIRKAVILAGVFSAALNILMLTGPLYMLQVYDRVIPSASIPTLIALSVVVLVLYGFFGLYDFLRARILSRASYRLDQLTASPAFSSWIRQGVPGNEGQAKGQPLRDLDTVRGFLSGPAVQGLFDLPWIPLYLGLAFVIHPVVGMLSLAGATVVVVVALINRRLTEALIERATGLESMERAFVEQGRRNAELIAALGMSARITERWRQMHIQALSAQQQGGERAEIASAFSKTFRMVLQSALLTAGAWLAIGQEISGGMIVAASIIAGRALAPVDQVISQWRAIGRAQEAHRRCLASFDPMGEEPVRIRLPAPTGALQVTGLTKFAPAAEGGGTRADRVRILDRVSFALSPGDGLGVIGNSASGKSTLARLLTGAWMADAGEIRLDGATPDQWDPEELGRYIGYLPQSVGMLSGTIRENIARFDPAVKDEAVIEAARTAGVHEMILRLPEGYATRIDPDRMPLSGGQIQRLGLARAIYGVPKIIVLDEPNANLDAVGDAALAQAITMMRQKGSVVIVMAHRPSAIAAVNKVMILHQGQVAQFGAKEDIMQPQAAGPVVAMSGARGSVTAESPGSPGRKRVAEKLVGLKSATGEAPVGRVPRHAGDDPAEPSGPAPDPVLSETAPLRPAVPS